MMAATRRIYLNDLTIGSEVRFRLNCSALIRAMTSPFVAKVVTQHQHQMYRTATPSLSRINGS